MHQFGELLVSSKHLCVYIYTYSEGWKNLKIPNRFHNFKTYVSEIVEHNLQIPSKISLVFQISIKPNKSMKMTNPTTETTTAGSPVPWLLILRLPTLRRRWRQARGSGVEELQAPEEDAAVEEMVDLAVGRHLEGYGHPMGNILAIYGVIEWYM